MAKEKSKSKSKSKSDKKEKKVRYDVFHERYKGNEVIAIYEVDKDGDKLKEYPVVSMGRKKWEVIMQNRDKVKQILNSKDEPPSED